MTKTFVWETISSFSGQEISKFGRFLASPAFNLRKDTVKLYGFLAAAKSRGNGGVSKREAFSHVFPGAEYESQKLRLAISRLNKVLEKFLIMEEVENTPFEKERLLVAACRRRKLGRNFRKAMNYSLNTTDSQPLRNSDYYQARYFLEYQNYLHISETGKKKDLNFKNMDRNLTLSFASTKLRLASFSLSLQAVSGDEHEILLLNELMELAKQPPYNEAPFIMVYFHFINLFKTGTEKEFEDFKNILFQCADNFTDEEFRDIYLAGLNFCIRKINDNQKAFFYEALDLYKKGLELELLLDNGKISRSTFNNIIGIALRIDEPDWVGEFINNYKKYLAPPHNVTAYNLNMARLEFVRKNYRKALSHLQLADYDDLLNHMNAKVLQVKIYYELDEFESLDSLLKSMRMFIRRKRNIGYHYQLWKNIIRYTMKLLKVNRYDKKAVASLEQDIQKEELLPEKEWLLEKLSER